MAEQLIPKVELKEREFKQKFQNFLEEIKPTLKAETYKTAVNEIYSAIYACTSEELKGEGMKGVYEQNGICQANRVRLLKSVVNFDTLLIKMFREVSYDDPRRDPSLLLPIYLIVSGLDESDRKVFVEVFITSYQDGIERDGYAQGGHDKYIKELESKLGIEGINRVRASFDKTLGINPSSSSDVQSPSSTPSRISRLNLKPKPPSVTQTPSSTPSPKSRPVSKPRPNLVAREAVPVAPVKEAPVALIELSEGVIKNFGRKLPFKVLTTLHSQSADSVFRTVKDEQGQQILQPPSRELVPGTIMTLKASLLLLINGSNIIDDSKKNQLRQAIAEQGDKYPTVGSILQALNNVQPKMELDQTQLTDNYELVLTGMAPDPTQNFDDILADENLTRMLTETPVESQNGKVFEVLAPTKTFITKLIGKVPSDELMMAITETQSACVNQTSNPLESLQTILKAALKDNPKRYNDILKSIINSTLFQFKLAGIQSKIGEGEVKKGWGERGKNALGVMAIAGVAIVASWLVGSGIDGAIQGVVKNSAQVVTAVVEQPQGPNGLEPLPKSKNPKVLVEARPGNAIGVNTNETVYAGEVQSGTMYSLPNEYINFAWQPDLVRFLTKMGISPNIYKIREATTIGGKPGLVFEITSPDKTRGLEALKLVRAYAALIAKNNPKVTVSSLNGAEMTPEIIQALIKELNPSSLPVLPPADAVIGNKSTPAETLAKAEAQFQQNQEAGVAEGYRNLGLGLAATAVASVGGFLGLKKLFKKKSDTPTPPTT
ncbi:MAG: hypothetical protein H7230_04680 [Candidatus Parcubacteria bacterium]|nr:hypothetical protein [Candidatus Paceibacterota bacterium]